MAKTMISTVRAFPRLHITLHDLAHATARRYGGIGLSIDCPHIEVEASVTTHTRITGDTPLLKRDRSDLTSALLALEQEFPGLNVTVRIKKLFPQHVGLGSKTALILATLTAAKNAARINLSSRRLIRISRRGGTSGIGVHAFFRGGLIVDGGHPEDPQVPFGPSSQHHPMRPPPLLVRRQIPRDWTFHLILSEGNRLSGTDEVTFFQDNTPLPKRDTLEVIALTYHGLVPAFADADFTLLQSSLHRIQRLGFKARELNRQTDQVRVLHRELEKDRRLAVGLSSVGPLLFAVSERDTAAIRNDVAALCAAHGARHLASSRGRNRGVDLL